MQLLLSEQYYRTVVQYYRGTVLSYSGTVLRGTVLSYSAYRARPPRYLSEFLFGGRIPGRVTRVSIIFLIFCMLVL